MDASSLTDLFVPSVNSPRIKRYISDSPIVPIVSDFAAGEFSSAVMRRVRMQDMPMETAHELFEAFDTWRAGGTTAVATEPVDVRLAAMHVRRRDLVLRMPDAIHLATAQRLGVALCSFDIRQVQAARQLGVHVVEIP